MPRTKSELSELFVGALLDFAPDATLPPAAMVTKALEMRGSQKSLRRRDRWGAAVHSDHHLFGLVS